ncbi:MAG: hypothetical protein Q4E91_10340 [Lachnospiraceae bacterium]|nr:hypothetical protein [Lachnospiraceae bacterium]
MAAEKNNLQDNEKVKDTKEFMELLKTLTQTEKEQVKGIMVGMQLSRQYLTTHTS